MEIITHFHIFSPLQDVLQSLLSPYGVTILYILFSVGNFVLMNFINVLKSTTSIIKKCIFLMFCFVREQKRYNKTYF